MKCNLYNYNIKDTQQHMKKIYCIYYLFYSEYKHNVGKTSDLY